MHFVLFLFVFILNLPTSVHLPRPDKKAGTNGVRSWEVSLYVYVLISKLVLYCQCSKHFSHIVC